MGEGARVFKYEMGSAFKDDHLPFKQYGVRVVDLIDFEYRIPGARDAQGREKKLDQYQQWWHTDQDTPAMMSSFGLKFFGDLVLLGLPRIEKRIYGAK
jgi:glutaminyl-peptide cyclotransferase